MLHLNYADVTVNPGMLIMSSTTIIFQEKNFHLIDFVEPTYYGLVLDTKQNFISSILQSHLSNMGPYNVDIYAKNLLSGLQLYVP